MAITRIAHVTARSVAGADVITGAINTTGADFLVAIANGQNDPSTWASGDMTDSKGNTWTMRTATVASANNLQVWDCVPTSVGTSHTFTLSATHVAYASICVAAYHGVDQTAPFDQQIRNAAATGTTVQPAILTPAESGELIVFAVGTYYPAGVLSVDDGFAMVDDEPYSGGNALGTGLADKIKTDAAAEHPTFTDTTSQENFPGTTLAYKAAASGAGPPSSGRTVLTVVGDASGVGVGTNDHGMQTGDLVTLAGFTGGAAVLNGTLAIVRIDATHFSVAVDTIGSPTTGQGTWSTRTGFKAPPWSISDAAREVSWIGFTGLWTMTPSMWKFPDRISKAIVALQDNPVFDTHPGTSYQYNALYGYVVADGYHFVNSWEEFEAINNHSTSDTAPLTNSEADYTSAGSLTHRGNAFGWNDPGFNTFYTIYANFMNVYGIKRGIAGAAVFQARLQAASDVLPELKRRAGFFAIGNTPPAPPPLVHHSMNTSSGGAVC